MHLHASVTCKQFKHWEKHQFKAPHKGKLHGFNTECLINAGLSYWALLYHRIINR